MTTLARVTAMALANDSIRQRVYQAIHNSKVREHKIRFADFLETEGGALFEEMARRYGADAGRIRAIRDTAVDLELYVPVKELNLGRFALGALIAGSKDDIVGLLVNPPDVGQSYPDANFVIVNKDGNIEGRMKLVKY